MSSVSARRTCFLLDSVLHSLPEVSECAQMAELLPRDPTSTRRAFQVVMPETVYTYTAFQELCDDLKVRS